MADINIYGNGAWRSACGCRRRLSGNTWSLALKNGDRLRDNSGNWITVSCPRVTFDVTVNEQVEPFAGANVQVRNTFSGDVHDIYTGYENFAFDDVYEGHKYSIAVIPEDYGNAPDTVIGIQIYKNGSPVPERDVTIPGAIGDEPDIFEFYPAPGDHYTVIVDVYSDTGMPATFYAKNNLTDYLVNWALYSVEDDLLNSGNISENGGTLDVETMLGDTGGHIALFAPVDGYYQIDYPPGYSGSATFYNAGDVLTTISSSDFETYKGSGFEYMAINITEA